METKLNEALTIKSTEHTVRLFDGDTMIAYGYSSDPRGIISDLKWATDFAAMYEAHGRRLPGRIMFEPALGQTANA